MPLSSVKEISAKRQFYARSPYFLGKDILGYKKFCETQIEWDEWIHDIFNFNPQKRAFAMKLAPRETFKSTFFVVTVAIHALLQNPNLTILIAAETQSNADAHLKEIKAKIESDTFRSCFGDWTSKDVWRDDAINISSRTLISKEASIETAGIGKSLTGKHYDLIIADDIVGMEDRDSPAKRQETFNFFNGLFDVLKKENGQLLLDGTRWHREDLYNHIINKLGPDLERKGLGRFHVSVVPAHAKNGGLNYPRLLSENRLQELRTVKQGKDGIDVTTFMAQYELDPLSPEEQVFKTLHYYNIKEVEYEHFILWTDPALSEKSGACYSAIAVIGKIKGEPWYGVPYASLAKRAPNKIKSDHNRIAKLHQDLYGVPIYCYMEDNGFQLLLVQQASKDSGEIQTIGRKNTENKLARIRGMEPFVSQGFIRFRDDWETAPEGYRLLVEQLTAFPQGLMDGPDALQSAHAQAQRGFNYCRTISKEGEAGDSTEPELVGASSSKKKKEFNFLDSLDD